jgi:hypothetical protein
MTKRMDINIIGYGRDHRTNTPVVYAQMAIPDYLGLVGEEFNTFAIQRKREKHKGYSRMRDDIEKGALLPPITLAIDPSEIAEVQVALEARDSGKLEAFITKGIKVNILDGLQRTFILRELKNEGKLGNTNQSLLLEFWFETKVSNLIYRIIVLNSGQKPMSLRHQIEVIFDNYKRVIEGKVNNLKLLTERDQARRTAPGRYAFERIIDAYQAFLNKSPEIRKDNIVAQGIQEEEILAADEDEWDTRFKDFLKYLELYVKMDKASTIAYPNKETLDWFGSENVLNAFFASISDFRGHTEDREPRILLALEKLEGSLNTIGATDPLGMEVYSAVTKGFDTKKVNVGVATRKLLFNSFKEFYRESGDKRLTEIWPAEAQ